MLKKKKQKLVIKEKKNRENVYSFNRKMFMQLIFNSIITLEIIKNLISDLSQC